MKLQTVWSWTSNTTCQEDDLKHKIQELEEAKRDLENSLVQLDLDCQQSIDKLVTLKDNLQKDYNDLEEECDALKIKEEKAEKRIAKLDNQLHKVQQENGDLKKQINTLNDENYLLKEQIASLKGNSYDEKVEQEKSDLHKKYINILASSMKKYVDGGNDVMEGMQDSNVIEYTKQVESVLKLLLDFKLKTESLEKELYDLREEKSKIIGEKNHEIEKLLKNSEILSQEVITKTQTIKDYENECSELMKNNDLLINELESYKNNSGLETISESNEDNMVLLEIQLENANKQINDLKEHFRVLEEENRELKTNFENNEYKYTELKVLQDGWNDEIEKYKKINKNLENINAECETKIQVLQNGVEELNKKLLSEEENRLQFETEKNNLMEKLQSSKMAETTLKLHFNKELQMAFEAKQEAENKFNKLSIEFEELKVCNEKLLQKHNELLEQQNKLVSSNTKKLTISETNCMSLESESNELIAELKTENAKIQSQLNELINLINEKQQENITYHTEIQRLNQIVLQKKQIEDNLHNEIEKLTDQNGFLQEKCEVLTQTLLQHQSTEKELERLRVHLVEIEETYTQELLLAEQKNQELQAKMNEIEEREKNSSTLYTSVSIRANQQVEALQNQIQMLTNQRDELRQKISDAEDENSRQAAALANLNFVLQQFQRDKENDVRQETERIRRQIKAEKQVQQELEQEIASLKSQLEESRQGLRAATRLGDQLEFTKKQNAALKEEVLKLQEQLKKSEAKQKELTSQTDGRVDKTLIKNLIIGLVSTNNNLNKDQYQILKIIATVLDFNQQEHDKVNLNKGQQNAVLQNSAVAATGQSLSEAFVRFLENESKPKVIPKLLNATKNNETNSNGSTPRQSSPIVLNEVMLPTFSDFGQSRNSSSILKDVLKDSS